MYLYDNTLFMSNTANYGIIKYIDNRLSLH